MKKIFASIFFACCFILGGATSNAEQLFRAKMAPLSQEEIGKSLSNPNPPSSSFEKRVVKFSETVVNRLLEITSTHSQQKLISPNDFQRPNIRIGMTEKELLSVECDSEKQKLMCNHTEDFIRTISALSEVKHGHLIPWAYERYKNSKNKVLKSDADNFPNSLSSLASPVVIQIPKLVEDEFMVHFHVKTVNGVWFHMNIILSETPDNELVFQRFFAIPVPTYNNEMPPGVLC